MLAMPTGVPPLFVHMSYDERDHPVIQITQAE
jgi:hypothetical protein